MPIIKNINPGIKEDEGCMKMDLLTEEEYLNIYDSLPKDNHILPNDDPKKFIAKMGAEAIHDLLAKINLDDLSKVTESDFTSKISSVYEAINLVKSNKLTENKSTIGFVGAPWTLLVYMINKQSPKLGLNNDFFKDLVSLIFIRDFASDNFILGGDKVLSLSNFSNA